MSQQLLIHWLEGFRSPEENVVLVQGENELRVNSTITIKLNLFQKLFSYFHRFYFCRDIQHLQMSRPSREFSLLWKLALRTRPPGCSQALIIRDFHAATRQHGAKCTAAVMIVIIEDHSRQSNSWSSIQTQSWTGEKNSSPVQFWQPLDPQRTCKTMTSSGDGMLQRSSFKLAFWRLCVDKVSLLFQSPLFYLLLPSLSWPLPWSGLCNLQWTRLRLIFIVSCSRKHHRCFHRTKYWCNRSNCWVGTQNNHPGSRRIGLHKDRILYMNLTIQRK